MRWRLAGFQFSALGLDGVNKLEGRIDEPIKDPLVVKGKINVAVTSFLVHLQHQLSAADTDAATHPPDYEEQLQGVVDTMSSEKNLEQKNDEQWERHKAALSPVKLMEVTSIVRPTSFTTAQIWR